MNNKELSQFGGDNSTNQQAVTINNHYHGPSENQIREIQAEIFRANMVVLAGRAAEIMLSRASDFSERLITEKLLGKPQRMISFTEPGMQMAAYEAQKHYAKSGDDLTANLLLDFLAARADNPERSLRQILLDECLSTVPKLNKSLIDKLSVLFLTNQGLVGIEDFNQLKQYLTDGLKPIVSGITVDYHQYDYLKYLNCIQPLVVDEEHAFVYHVEMRVPGLFYPGIPIEEFEKLYGDVAKYKSCFEPDISNPKVVKQENLSDLGSDAESNDRWMKMSGLISVIRSDPRMNSDARVQELLDVEEIAKAENLWLASPLSKFTNTYVGALIGQAHLKHCADINTQQIPLE